MKTITLAFTLVILVLNTKAEEMKEQLIETSIGTIVVQIKEVENTIPIIFLHGVYLDHNLWNYQTSRIQDRTVITLDMPLHGKSKTINNQDWTLDDCATMLIEVLDELNVEKVIAIGHSWGSMTLLRASAKYPERFQSIGFCNMPFEEASFGGKLLFNFQHLMLGFRDFYIQQAANAIFGTHSKERKQELLEHLQLSMSSLSREEVIATDENVIIRAKDASALIEKLRVPALAVIGKEDYVPTPEPIKTKEVSGGHVSPIEAPQEVMDLVKEVIELSE